MTRYMFYFHYWLSVEPIKAVIDFDPHDKAKVLFEEVYEEITYHIGEEPNPGSLLFVEIFGLRPFNPVAWEMNLEQFVSFYGNEFVVFDLERSYIGDIEHFRPRQIAGGQRNKFKTISATDEEEWPKRAKLETRLVSTLIRYFQFHKKTKWLLVQPLDSAKFHGRVWKVFTDIPETNYSAEWRLIIPQQYPEQVPKLFLRNRDFFIVEDEEIDISLVWKDPDGTIYYHITWVNEESTRWEDDGFIADILLTGVWNFLVRSLHSTFKRIYFYKVNINRPSTLMDTPAENKSPTTMNKSHRSLDEEHEFEEEPDWRVQITEAMEDIAIDQQVLDTKKTIKNKKKNPEPILPKINKALTKTSSKEAKYQDWLLEKNDSETLQMYAELYTWMLQRVPERALKELNQLKEFDSEHELFYMINWRLVQYEIAEEELLPFASYIIRFYLERAENEIYDTDREFLRETVLKKWKNTESVSNKVSELRVLLKKHIKQIRQVEFYTL